jgi:uncharacterized protein (UPF0548 family)
MAAGLRRPTPERLAGLLRSAAHADLTYEPVGMSLDGSTPAGLVRRAWQTGLDGDSDTFTRAREALEQWAVHRGSGLDVVTDGPLAAGTHVAMAAPLPVGWVEATCRIVSVVDEADRFGFAYGTLPVHPERGEESFVVHRQDGACRFVVTAVSRPVHPLARLAPPVADRLQAIATGRYLSAMGRAVR